MRACFVLLLLESAPGVALFAFVGSRARPTCMMSATSSLDAVAIAVDEAEMTMKVARAVSSSDAATRAVAARAAAAAADAATAAVASAANPSNMPLKAAAQRAAFYSRVSRDAAIAAGLCFERPGALTAPGEAQMDGEMHGTLAAPAPSSPAPSSPSPSTEGLAGEDLDGEELRQGLRRGMRQQKAARAAEELGQRRRQIARAVEEAAWLEVADVLAKKEAGEALSEDEEARLKDAALSVRSRHAAQAAQAVTKLGSALVGIHTYMHASIHAYMHTCTHARVHTGGLLVRSDALGSIWRPLT